MWTVGTAVSICGQISAISEVIRYSVPLSPPLITKGALIKIIIIEMAGTCSFW